MQQYFDARDLGWNIIEPDILSGGSRTMIHVGFWRARFDLRANAAISPIKTELFIPSASVRTTCKANATILSA